MCKLSPVTFHGDTIFCIDYQNQPYTPMKPIVQNMGLDWASQSVKLNANKARWGVVMIATPSEGGEQKMLSMPVRKLPAWLNSINPKKVKPELRERIELYQAECDDALWNYWMNGRAERPAPAPGSEEERKRRLARERLRRHRERKREQLALLPAPKPYREQCAEVVAEMHALHGEFFKVSEKMMNTFAKPFYATALSPIPEHMKPFAHAMNLAINNFWMAMFKDFATLEDLYRAYVEAEKVLNG